MLRFGRQTIVGLFLFLVPVYGISQNLRDNATPSTSNLLTDTSSNSSRVGPSQEQLFHFVGVYQPDGSFNAAPVHPALTRLFHVEQGELQNRSFARPAEVPPFVNLQPRERVVSNFQPRHHGSAPLKGHSLLANLRDQIIVLAYGRQNLLRSPTHVTTDSHQRIIISDPNLHAIHVLESNGKGAFRIQGGPQGRFQSPEAIAVDADDNIYFVDSSRSAVLVFDPEGNYLRTIGTFKGESQFESLGGLAIDRKSGILYVIDPSANELLLFSREGELMSLIGGRSNDRTTLIHPTEVTLAEGKIIVLDDFGSRVQVFDVQHRLLNSFRVRPSDSKPVTGEVGLSSDSAGLIYLSNLFPDKLAVFNQSGNLVALIGQTGNRIEEFKVPSGVWIDSTDRIYIADTENSRVQVFRAGAAEKFAAESSLAGKSP